MFPRHPNPENRPINIKRLVIESPEPRAELPFDSERDITEEDWKMMQTELDKARRDGEHLRYITQAFPMKLLDPRLHITLSEENISEIREYPEQAKWAEFVYYFSQAKIIDPSLPMSIDDYDDEYIGDYNTWAAIEDALAGEKNMVSSFIPLANAIRIIDTSVSIPIGEEMLQDCKKTLAQYREEQIWTVFSAFAANLRLLCPSFDLKLSKEDWKGMHEELDVVRRKNLSIIFAEHAANMSILAAEKVEITDQGIQLTMPKRKQDLKTQIPPIPEPKKF